MKTSCMDPPLYHTVQYWLSGKILKARGCQCEHQLSDHPKIFVNIFFGGNYVVKESGDFCPGLQQRPIYLLQRKISLRKEIHKYSQKIFVGLIKF